MPIFEYRCISCGAEFEDIRTSSTPEPECPQCASTSVEKIISVPGPLKKGAFPFKPGPVHPMAKRMGMGCGGVCPGKAD